MIIFWRLLLSHLLADFTLQFNIVNRLKRKNVWGMLIHCLTHLVVSIALTWPYLSDIWISSGSLQINGWWALIIMFVVHFAVDELRIYSMKAWYKDNTISFLMDQVVHIFVLFFISPVAISGSGLLMGEKWAAIGAMLVLVTHFTTVLIYFLEKDIFGKTFPGFDEKYFLIFERVVIWAFFFAAGHWWILFAVAWVFQLFYVKRKRIMDLSSLNVWVSVAMGILTGVCTRLVYYGGL